jgi:hypothetical protein
LIYPPAKVFFFKRPLGHTKTKIFVKKNKNSFLYGLLGGILEKKYFTRGKSKKIFYRG